MHITDCRYAKNLDNERWDEVGTVIWIVLTEEEWNRKEFYCSEVWKIRKITSVV